MGSNRPKLVVAAAVNIYINGKLFGLCTSFSWTSNTQRKEIQCIDIAHAVELAATRTSVVWQMGVLRTRGDGGMQGASVVANQANVIKEKYFTILLVERTTNLPIFKADLCNTDSENWVLTAKGLMAGTVQGKGITWVNEADQQ
jgi:hypothetical protein